MNAEVERGRYMAGSRGRGPTLAGVVLIVAVVTAPLLLVGGSSSGVGG